MINRFFPFHRLGFRCNPFRALTDEEWSELAFLSTPMETAVLGGSQHIQVLGDEGRGKTTALLGLYKRLKDSGYHAAYEYLPEGQGEFSTRHDSLDVFLLDEAQRLRKGETKRLLSTVRHQEHPRLVLGSHENMEHEFRRYGLRLTTVRLSGITRQELEKVLTRRLAYFSLDAIPRVRFSADAIDYLHESYGGNMRSMQLFLYGVFQQLDSEGEVTANDLRRSEAARLP